MTTSIETTEADYVAPYNYRCSNAECNDIIVGFNLPVETPGIGKPVCRNHIVADQDFCFARIGDSGAGYDPKETMLVDISDGKTFRFMKNLRSAVIAAVDATQKSNERRISAVQELERFKNKVVEEVVGWADGCRSGKEEFLDALGLEWPSVEVTVTCTFSYKGDVDDLSSSEFEYAISNAIEGEYEGFYVEIDY